MSERDGVVVVGGGVGGLLAAITAAGHGASTVLIEPHPLGGRARTDDRSGFTFNRGPRALYVGGAAEAALGALGVDTATGGAPVLAQPGAIARGTIHAFPAGPVSTLRTSLFTGREKLSSTRALLPLLRDPGPIDPELSLAAWLDARGVHGTLRSFLEAMVRVATYTNAPEVVPAGLALAQARSAANAGVRYLDGGFGSIVDQLAALARARGVAIHASTATAVRADEGGWRVTADGSEHAGRSVVLAAGSPSQAASLLGGAPAGWGGLAPGPAAACLELGVRGVPRRRFCLGIDEPTYLSVHSPPARLAPEGHSVVHVVRYRPVDDPMAPDEVRSQLHRVVRLAGIDAGDIVEERFLSSLPVAGTTPAAGRGLEGRPTVEVAGHRGAFVVGDWVGPTGLLLDAVVASAVDAGERAARRCATMASA